MKLENKKFFCISIDTFVVEVAFFINYPLAEAIKETGKKKKYHTLSEYLTEHQDHEWANEKGVDARMYPLTKGYAVFLRFYKNSHRHNVAILSHEVSHLVSWILLDRRILLSKDSDEVYAYLTEEITKKFLLGWY